MRSSRLLVVSEKVAEGGVARIAVVAHVHRPSDHARLDWHPARERILREMRSTGKLMPVVACVSMVRRVITLHPKCQHPSIQFGVYDGQHPPRNEARTPPKIQEHPRFPSGQQSLPGGYAARTTTQRTYPLLVRVMRQRQHHHRRPRHNRTTTTTTKTKDSAQPPIISNLRAPFVGSISEALRPSSIYPLPATARGSNPEAPESREA
ncbi:hypothetical protein LZ31DRAFT_192535 [Colletotrichum somersetense]|nr:hypothetical protein LZ31DRAFT_192535 [Colletotrichum somersetense]